MEYFVIKHLLPLIVFLIIVDTTANKTNSYDNQGKKFNASENNPAKWRLPLIHIDNFRNVSSDFTTRVNNRLQRDIHRMKTLRLGMNGPTTSQLDQDNEDYEFGSTTLNGQTQGIGEFLVEVQIGTPPTTQHLEIDTGSDLTWFQCGPCLHCYKQTDPIIEWWATSSLTVKSCDTRACNHWFIGYSDCVSYMWVNNQCYYAITYGDRSYSKGWVVTETITIGGVVIRDVAMGCANENGGYFIGASGILGLGGGHSFLDQLGHQVGGTFSYCLRSGRQLTGWLEFGRGSIPENAMWVPLVFDERVSPTFYYVGLTSIAVGGQMLPIPEDAFQITGPREGGVIIDSGTTVTRFPREVYGLLRDAFISQFQIPPLASGFSLFDTCFDLSSLQALPLPSISLHFSNGFFLSYGYPSILYQVDEKGTYCLAFAPSSTPFSIIGNLQQEDIVLTYDVLNSRVGFTFDAC